MQFSKFNSKNLILFTHFFFLLGSGNIYAQDNAVFGKIIDSESSEPLAGVHVFFDKTTLGTITDSSGNFSISGIPPGTYTLVMSYVGYVPFEKPVTFPGNEQNYFNVKLKPDLVLMDRIEVKTKSPREWLRNLKRFETLFLGETSNALETKIVNPQVLEFTNNSDLFKATALEPLIINNHALGYEITYFLKEFIFENNSIKISATTKYKEMEPEDPSDIENWIWERKRAYFGSFKHFIVSLHKGSAIDEGFSLFYQTNRKITPNGFGTSKVNRIQNLISISEEGENTIVLQIDKNFPYLRVDYMKEPPERRIKERYRLRSTLSYQTSFIRFPNGKAILDLQTTNAKEPYVPMLYGYWGWTSRIPELLPQDFSIEHYLN